MTARFIVADVFDGLAGIEDGTVDLVVTSPPFLALRSYLPADHPDKDKEIGSEANPAEWLDVLLRVTAELRRVLAPHGSIAIELGDTYAGGWIGESTPIDDRLNAEGGPRIQDRRRTSHVARNKLRDSNTRGWPLPKSKALIPELYRVALAYGINPLTGQESPAGRWRIRNVVTWCRPNPPVGALGDKWRPATSDIVVACTSDKRYWDDIATRREHKTDPTRPGGPKMVNGKPGQEAPNAVSNPAGAPLLDWWELPPSGYHGAHYAVYPPALVEPLIKAMAPPKVCRTCGEPSRRIVEPMHDREFNRGRRELGAAKGWNESRRDGGAGSFTPATFDTVGWSDCGHNNWRPALILDPFAGSGTTLAVATGHGHDAIGIDLDERNYQLALERVGPMLLGPPERVESHLR